MCECVCVSVSVCVCVCVYVCELYVVVFLSFWGEVGAIQ